MALSWNLKVIEHMTIQPSVLRVPDTYILYAPFRHHYPVFGEFTLEYHRVLQKNEGLILHMRFGPGCQVPVCIYPYVYRGVVGATVSSHGYCRA
jgi:hypothetical protein